MAVIPIRLLNDSILRQKAKRVKTIDNSIQKLIDDMLETNRAASGAGLAAPQVGVSLRLAIIQLSEDEEYILINPQIMRRTGTRTVTEGCLSIPGYVGDIQRSEKVSVRATDRNGKEYRVRSDGLLAEALEHEIDHLNGVLYIDYLDSLDELRKVELPQPTELL
ncbi:MAG TPA: peptide deformylase [Dehalococcoidia bacterium]|nr:peptide deformylase [Dehalococcoidia bacterium]